MSFSAKSKLISFLRLFENCYSFAATTTSFQLEPESKSFDPVLFFGVSIYSDSLPVWSL